MKKNIIFLLSIISLIVIVTWCTKVFKSDVDLSLTWADEILNNSGLIDTWLINSWELLVDSWLMTTWLIESWTLEQPVTCTMDYNPVCAKVQVQCIMAPCPPIEQTFWNRCTMEANKLAEFAYTWECKTAIETWNISTWSVTSKNIVEKTAKYIVKTEPLTDDIWEKVYVYSSAWKLIMSIVSADPTYKQFWRFYKLVGNILFIDYWTAVGWRTIKLFDLSQKWKIIFDTRYNWWIVITGNKMIFKFSYYPDPKWIVCDNYDQIKNMWWSVNYEQKRSYDFKTKKLEKIWKIYCAYWE
jgi:hypothetical protein